MNKAEWKIALTPPPWTNVSKNTVILTNEEFIPSLTMCLLDTKTALEARQPMFKKPHLIFLKGSCVRVS